MKLLEKINTVIFQFFTWLLLSRKKRLSSNPLSQIIIIAHHGIGDCLLFFPVIKTLQNNLPKVNITIITHSQLIADILTFHFSNINTITINLRKLSIINRIKFFIKMRRQKYDLLLSNFLGVKKEYVQLGLFCRIPNRIGHVYGTLQNGGKFDFFYNYPIEIGHKHYLEMNLDLLKPFNFDKIDDSTFFFPKQSAILNVDKFLINISHSKFIILQPYSAANLLKNWPRENYVALVHYIQREFGLAVIVVGSPEERPELERIFAPSDLNHYITAGQFDFWDHVSLIQKSIAFVGNDGGLAKIAIAMNIPTITIWGPSDYDRAKSWKTGHMDIISKVDCAPCTGTVGIANNKICKNPDKLICLRNISVEQVMENIRFLTDLRRN